MAVKKEIPLRGKIFMWILRIAIIGLAIWYFAAGQLGVLIFFAFVVVANALLERRARNKMKKNRMKIALDIHGVCDTNPKFFKELTRLFISNGHEVHILTGRRVKDGALDEIEELGLEYTHFFSITDYHHDKGTEVNDDENGDPWIDDIAWDRSKGDYCKRNNIDFCIDDTERYGQYFETPFAYMNIKKD